MPKLPTNRDIIQEIKVVQATLLDHDGRLKSLEIWKISSDAVKEALEKYRPPDVANGSLSKELLRVIALAVGAIVTLVGAIVVLNQ